MNAKIEITTDNNGCATKLLLNGTDISDMVSAVTFRQIGGAMPTVALTFIADRVSIKTNAFVRYPQELLDAVMKKREVREMKIIIKGEAKEIAALVLAVQERQGPDVIEELSGEMLTRLQKAVDDIR